MEQMSLTAPIFVLIELLRPLALWLSLLLITELALLIYAIRRRSWRIHSALKGAGACGLTGGVLTAFLALPLTSASLINLQGGLDYLAYLGIILGMAVAVFIASLPPLLALTSGTAPLTAQARSSL